MNSIFANYILCWFFGMFVLLSFIGWGQVLAAFLFRDQNVGLGQKAAWGICFSVLFGGILNYYALIYKWIIWAYLIMGCVAVLCTVGKGCVAVLIDLFRMNRKRIFLFCGTVGIFLCIMFAYSRSVYTAVSGPYAVKEFNSQDDYLGYFVCVEKMTQTHTLKPDPFNARQMVSSLGGIYFLQAIVWFNFPQMYIAVMDQGIGLLVTVLLLLEICRKKKIDTFFSLLLIFLFIITPFSIYVVNISSFILPICLFLALYIVFDSGILVPGRYFSNAVIVALIASSLCSLKTTNIVMTGCFVLMAYIILFYRNGTCKRHIFLEMCLMTVLVFIMLLPWMIVKYQSYGTALYPLLGRGYSSYAGSELFSNPGAVLSPFVLIKTAVSALNDIYIVGLLILACVYFYWGKQANSTSCFLKSFILSSITGLGVSALMLSRLGMTRYSFPFVYTGMMILLAEMASCLRIKEIFPRHIPFFAGLLVVAGMIIGDAVRDFSPMFYRTAYRVTNLFEGQKIASEKQNDTYKALQQSIPESEILLTRLEKPFLLDFQRNTVFVADIPAEISPPPGMPTGKGAEALAEYLMSLSIRYVAYSYATQAGYTRQGYGDRLNPSAPPWLQREAANTFDFQDNLSELMKTREWVYDDGQNCILDLQKKASR